MLLSPYKNNDLAIQKHLIKQDVSVWTGKVRGRAGGTSREGVRSKWEAGAGGCARREWTLIVFVGLLPCCAPCADAALKQAHDGELTPCTRLPPLLSCYPRLALSLPLALLLALTLFALAVNAGEGGQGTMHMKGNRDTELSERVSRVSE